MQDALHNSAGPPVRFHLLAHWQREVRLTGLLSDCLHHWKVPFQCSMAMDDTQQHVVTFSCSAFVCKHDPGKQALEMRHLLGMLQTVAPQVDAHAMSRNAAGEGVS